MGRNLPAITETNSGPGPVAERSLFQALGEFGSPLFTPWSLIVSYSTREKPYVLPDGELANGAFALSAAYQVLNEALPAISIWGGTDRAKVFLADLPGTRFSETKMMEGLQVNVEGDDNGQAIALQPDAHELILIGYRCEATLDSSSSTWPPLDRMKIETGRWVGGEWGKEGAPVAVSDDAQRPGPIRIYLTGPQVVRVSWQTSSH